MAAERLGTGGGGGTGRGEQRLATGGGPWVTAAAAHKGREDACGWRRCVGARAAAVAWGGASSAGPAARASGDGGGGAQGQEKGVRVLG